MNQGRTFVAVVSLPIPAFNYDEVVSSSFGVTVTDGGATGGVADGIIDLDLGTAATLYPGSVNVTNALLTLDPVTGLPVTTAQCPAAFPGCSALAGNGVASLAVTPGVATEIRLELNFTLSPGDSAGFTSRFEIVPEPSTALLLAIGLVGVAARRARRV